MTIAEESENQSTVHRAKLNKVNGAMGDVAQEIMKVNPVTMVKGKDRLVEDVVLKSCMHETPIIDSAINHDASI